MERIDYRVNSNETDHFVTRDLNDIPIGDGEDVVSIGHWIALYAMFTILSIIPFIGRILVLLIICYMAFGDINSNLKNWARASLITVIIVMILFLITKGSLFYIF